MRFPLYVCMQGGGSFKPFKLPSSALFFKPPKTKTENMQKKDFLGHAKVVSSIQDNDDFTGFLGAQGQVRNSATLVLTLDACFVSMRPSVWI